MKYIIYCRKSSEEDRKQYQSLDTQEHLLTELAKSRGLDVVQIFRESKSARFSNNRPLFAEMISLIKSGVANGILAYHVDRLSRNLKDAGEITELMDKGFLHEVRTPNDCYITSSDLLKMNINYVFAENYSRELSEKVRSGNDTKIRKGEYPSMGPIGYINVKNGIVPDPDRAFYIKKIFELYDSGVSIGKIVKIAFEEGFRSKRDRKLYKSSIGRILTNPEYYGVIRRKGTLYAGNHESLITKALFDKVQDRLNQKTRSKTRELFFLYRDYLVCHKCGCKLTATMKKGKYIYYYCTNTKNICNEHRDYIKESEMEGLLLNLMENIIPDKELFSLSFQRFVFNKKAEIKNSIKERELAQKQLDLLQKRLDKLEDMYLEERISGEKYDVKKRDIQSEITDLQMLLKNPNKDKGHSKLELVENFRNRAISLWKLFYDGNDEVKKEILESVLWNCGILNKKIVTTRYKLPYSHLKKFGQTTDLAILSERQDSNLRPYAPHAYVLAI